MIPFKSWIAVSLLICFLCADGNCQQAPEFSKIAAIFRQGKLDSPLDIASDRLAFNDCLASMPLPWVVQGRLTSEQVEELRKMTDSRAAALKKNIDYIQIKWTSLSSQERSVEIAHIENLDEQHLKSMFDRLDELLSPSQRRTLATIYMTNQGGPFSCADPILRNWVGVTEAEARQIRTRYEISSLFIVSKLKERNLSPLSRLPVDEESEFIRLQILAWEGIDADKMKRILVYSGLLHEEEDLADYVERFKEVGEVMVKQLPAFAEAVKKKKEAMPK